MSPIPHSRAQIIRVWFLRVLLVGAVAFVSIALLRWQATLTLLGDYLICSDAPRPVDLILVLGGDFYGPRVYRAAELLWQGYAQTVLISSPPYKGLPEGEFTIERLAEQGFPTGAYEVFAHTAASTVEEAIALRAELARRRVKRVLLVTSAYHSRRSAIVFRLFCPGIHFISAPAPDQYFRPEGWWTDQSSRDFFFLEWKKILGSVFYAYPSYLLGNKKAFAAGISVLPSIAA